MARTECQQLRMENERLYSHHSNCKAEIGRLVETAQKWRIRAWVCEELLSYLNKLNPFWYPDDLTKEVKLQTEERIKQWHRREKWWESPCQ